MKVREHRQELNKFMKEVRARDPARRMVTMVMMMIINNYDYNMPGAAI